MADKIYTVLGATGNIGHTIVEQLLKTGAKVRAVGRDPKKLQSLKTKGAETVACEFDNTQALTEALKGTTAAFCLLPPGYHVENYGQYQDKVGEATLDALKQNKVQYVVNLSSVGGNLTDKTGPIKGLHRQEDRLNALSSVNVLHLRPNYFMENLLVTIPIIQQMGVMATALKGNLSIPMVATRDIGLKAAEFLKRLDFKGHTVFDFEGPRTVTLEEASRIIGKEIGKPELKYVQVTYAQAEQGMITSGMKPAMAALMMEMTRAFNDGLIKPTQTISQDHRGTITLEQFAKDFVKAFNHVDSREKAHH